MLTTEISCPPLDPMADRAETADFAGKTGDHRPNRIAQKHVFLSMFAISGYISKNT
jgi:hypothetical protein